MTASLPAKIYPGLSRYLIREFLQAVARLSIVVILGLFVTFEAENFKKGPAVLLTEGIENLRLGGLLTLIAITHRKLGELITLTRYPEQMEENMRMFDMKRSTESWTKVRDLIHTLIQNLLQQSRLGTEEDKTMEKKKTCDVVRRACHYLPI